MSDDVTQAETTASTTSVEENTQPETNEIDQSQDTKEEDINKTIPYDRFAQVNEERKKYREELERYKAELEKKQAQPTTTTPDDYQKKYQADLVKNQLKELGFVSKEELEEREADLKLDQQLNSLETKYNGKNGLPKFDRYEALKFAKENMIGDLESAYKLKHEKEIMDYNIKLAMGKVGTPTKSEASDGSGSANVGETNKDLISSYEKGDSSALRTLLKRQL